MSSLFSPLSRSAGKEENKPLAANQASYGTKPLILPPVTGREVLSLPGRKAGEPFEFSDRLIFKSQVEDGRRGFH